VTDLGTEFGVATTTDVGTHVEVFRGKVIASALSAQPGAVPKTLARDQAAEVPQDGSSVDSAALKRVEFVRPNEFTIIQQANVSAYHRWLAYSYELRHDPQLALYYSFESAANTDILSNAALTNVGQFDLTLSNQTPPVPQVAPGRWSEKSAAVFDSSKHNRLLLADCPLSKTGKLSIAAWIKAQSRPTWATIAKSRGDTVNGQFSLGLFDNDGDFVARVWQADGTDSMIRQGKQNPVSIGQWVFVAMVADGDHLRLYRDGLEVASAPCTAVITNPVIRSLSIGFQPANDGKSTRRQTEGYWNGAIDELAFFHRPLSEMEIKQMYEAGKPD
jgi:Concanavalin A-like lectin/glucanases superfamily